ncbi:5-hydroxytryptamine receptor 3A-like [Eleginops maclovinus]|uniref:5-hydroxytryptamine receptor 3A-like n=1 Tax=Eleginops maclovinus TaxID=56733 RepID=UPI003080BBF6
MSALRTLAFLALVGVSSSQTSDCSYVGLLTHLNLTTTNDLLATMRPVKSWTTPTLVQLDMLLYGILEVDEKTQTVTTHIWVEMRWTNEFLTWNPEDFCEVNVLTVPQSKLWLPDVQILEDVSDTSSIHRSSVVNLYPNGTLSAPARQRMTSTCWLNLLMFPFDTQECNITFSSINSDGSAIQLGSVNTDKTLTLISEKLMITKGEWELTKMEIIVFNGTKTTGRRHELTYKVIIARKPMLYVINLIIPLLYFLVLDFASFFISEDRGEKLSFKVTILLSISVMLLILKDILPSTEKKLPWIASYCVAIFTIVGLSVLEAMLVGYLYDLDGCCCKTAQSPADAQVDIQLEDNNPKEPAGAKYIPEKSSLPLDRLNGYDLLKLILEKVKATQQEVEEQNKDQRKPGRCRRAAVIIDSVFFALYFLTDLVFLSYMNTHWFSAIYSY